MAEDNEMLRSMLQEAYEGRQEPATERASRACKGSLLATPAGLNTVPAHVQAVLASVITLGEDAGVEEEPGEARTANVWARVERALVASVLRAHESARRVEEVAESVELQTHRTVEHVLAARAAASANEARAQALAHHVSITEARARTAEEREREAFRARSALVDALGRARTDVHARDLAVQRLEAIAAALAHELTEARASVEEARALAERVLQAQQRQPAADLEAITEDVAAIEALCVAFAQGSLQGRKGDSDDIHHEDDDDDDDDANERNAKRARH
jgi:hypothetical protein